MQFGTSTAKYAAFVTELLIPHDERDRAVCLSAARSTASQLNAERETHIYTKTSVRLMSIALQ